ncbi:MAG: carboxymuconolactone decarboxylase family protein [Polyangiaceae bacterium]
MNTDITNPRFPSLHVEDAPAGSRPFIAASAKQFGFLPSPIAKAAGSPPLLGYLLQGFRAFDASSLSPIEREVLALTVAFVNRCGYCVALHSTLLSRDEQQRGLVGALREGRALDDPRLEALRRLTVTILERRARIDDASLEAFYAAGYTRTNALDVMLGVGVYVLSTYVNVFTEAELDAPFEPQRWSPPAG